MSNILRKKNVLFGFVIALALDSLSANAVNPNRNKTTWGVVNQSLTDLLNDGWQLLSQGSNRAAIPRASERDSTGVGTVTSIGFDEETFTFMLLKNGKYVLCLVSNPNVAQGTYSQCRSLN